MSDQNETADDRPVDKNQEEIDQDSIENIFTGSNFFTKLNPVRNTEMSLIVSVGYRKESGESREQLLLPAIEFRMEGDGDGDGDDTQPLLSTFIPFDNGAFILGDIAIELEQVCAQLLEINKGGISASRDVFQRSARYLAVAEESIHTCREMLLGLVDKD
jgi:hypothetical protein